MLSKQPKNARLTLAKKQTSAFTSQECVQFFLDQRDGLLWPHSLQTKVKLFFASTG